MSKRTQKFYWLKLTNDFFNREEIKLIEKEENGTEYICFYLKILLLSINKDGSLTFKGKKPYTVEMLATITNTDYEIAENAIELLYEYGLVCISKENTICLTEVNQMIGSETGHASSKRKFRTSTGEEEVSECEGEEVKTESIQQVKEINKKKVNEEKKEDVLVDEKEDIKTENCTKDGDKGETKGRQGGDKEETLSHRDRERDRDRVRDRVRDRNHHLLLQKDEEGSEEAADDNKSYFNIAKKLEQCNFGLPSPHIVNKLLADVEIYGEKFVSDAIEAADEYGVRKYPYVKSILDKWKTDGKGEKGVGRNNKKNNGKNYSKIYDLSKWEKGSDEPFDGQDIETEY